MNHITCGIKTFLRDEKLAQCLSALVGKGFHSVIVADDGIISPAKRAVYDNYGKLLPLYLIELPFDTGISAGRNVIVEHCRTEYLLLLDDDQIMPENINDLLVIMKDNESLGGISGIWDEYGKIRCDARNLYFSGKYVIKDIREKAKRMTTGNLSYYLYEFIPNSTLFRTECLRQIPWDPYYKIGSEHLDFYLAHQKLGRWKFAITPDVIIIHDPREHTTRYREEFRKNADRLSTSLSYLYSKWGIVGIIENKSHTNEPGGSPKRQQLISQLIRIGVPPDKAVLISRKVPAWILRKFF